MNDWTDEDQPTPRRNLSTALTAAEVHRMSPATYYRLSTNFCPCPDCTADDGAQTTPLDPEEFN